jgi:hypothetical protein
MRRRRRAVAGKTPFRPASPYQIGATLPAIAVLVVGVLV